MYACALIYLLLILLLLNVDRPWTHCQWHRHVNQLVHEIKLSTKQSFHYLSSRLFTSATEESVVLPQKVFFSLRFILLKRRMEEKNSGAGLILNLISAAFKMCFLPMSNEQWTSLLLPFLKNVVTKFSVCCLWTCSHLLAHTQARTHMLYRKHQNVRTRTCTFLNLHSGREHSDCAGIEVLSPGEIRLF